MAVTPVGQPVAAIKSTTSSGSFASFSPNSGSAYIVCVSMATDGAAAASSTVAWASGGSGTWARLVAFQVNIFQPAVEIWWVHCSTAPGSSQISVTGNAHVTQVFSTVDEVTGHHTTTQNGATATSSATSAAISVTPNQTGSRVFQAFIDNLESFTPAANGSSTVLDSWTATGTGNENFACVTNSSTTAGTPVSVGCTNTVTGSNQCAVEIVPAPAAANNAVQAAGQFPPFNAPFIEPNAVPFQLQGDRAGVTQITLSDTGAADDSSFTVSAAVPLADTGAGADSITVTAAVPLADTGTADDSSFTVAAAVPLSDTGTAADAISVNIVDYGYVASPLPFPPFSPPFIEPNIVPLQLQGDRSAIPQISLADTGTADDSSFTVTAAVPLTDSGAGADAVTVAAAVPLADTGAAADAVTVTAAVPLADTGTASDSISIIITGGDSPTYPTATPLWPPLMFVIQPPVFQFAGGLGVVPITTIPPYTVTASDTAAVGVTSTSSPAASVTGASSAAVNVTSTTTP